MHKLEHLIPDYLNEHLCEDDLREFERVLATDTQLQELVQLEKRVQNAMRAPATDAQVNVSFDTFKDKLERPPLFGISFKPAMASAFVMMCLTFVVFTQQQVTEPKFETTTTPLQNAHMNIVRIAVSNPAELDRLIDIYNLDLLRQFDGAGVIDVDGAELSTEDLEQLRQDDAVSFVKRIEQTEALEND